MDEELGRKSTWVINSDIMLKARWREREVMEDNTKISRESV